MIRLDLYLHDVIVLSNVRQSASYRGSFASVALRVQHVPVRIQRREESEQSYVSELKEVDDVLGGSAAWENVDSTEERCPKCSNPRAYFMQIQTRSADEPMTTFYKCCNPQCGHNWRD